MGNPNSKRARRRKSGRWLAHMRRWEAGQRKIDPNYDVLVDVYGRAICYNEDARVLCTLLGDGWIDHYPNGHIEGISPDFSEFIKRGGTVRYALGADGFPEVFLTPPPKPIEHIVISSRILKSDFSEVFGAVNERT